MPLTNDEQHDDIDNAREIPSAQLNLSLSLLALDHHHPSPKTFWRAGERASKAPWETSALGFFSFVCERWRDEDGHTIAFLMCV